MGEARRFHRGDVSRGSDLGISDELRLDHDHHYSTFHTRHPVNCISTMIPTRTLLGQARLTLFTRAGCGLCDTAKHTIVQLNKRRPFYYVEKDIMDAGNKQWKDVYEFDVPVLHIQSVNEGLPKEADLSDSRKLFHRWTEKEVEQQVDEAEK